MNSSPIIFRATEPVPQGLGELSGRPFWCAWRTEPSNGRITKIPYCARGRKAESNNRYTWRTLDQAADVAIDIGGDGVGIFLGVIDFVDHLRLGGIDLDSCRDTGTGEITPWATKVIKRFNSYTEISPSRTGVKVFFLYMTQQWDGEIKPLLNGNKSGRQWKRRVDHDHAPGIEMYVTCRFFAVTGQSKGFPDRLRVVDAADLKWLALTYGPRFKGKATPATRTPSGEARKNLLGSKCGDGSRSARAFAWMRVFHRMNLPYAVAKERLLTLTEDPSVAEWAATKGLDRGEYEMRRVYDNAKPKPGSVDDQIADMARQFAEEDQA
jgi:putative DNA primase/helicase